MRRRRQRLLRAPVLNGSHVRVSLSIGASEADMVTVTVQPFRQEIDRVIATYLNEGGPRELNISSRERAAVLHALARTTHPSAFQAVAATVECSLRYQAHPNFIRWVIYNGNHARVVFARGLGLGGIILGFVAAVLITLSHAGRGWRAMAAVGWFIGISTLFAAWKGMCVVRKSLFPGAIDFSL